MNLHSLNSYILIGSPYCFEFLLHVTIPLPGAMDSLGKEIVPNLPPAAASVEYRKSLAISLFFKVILLVLLYFCRLLV